MGNMSEHQKRLTEYLCNVAAGRPTSFDTAVDAAGHVDALLAEHRDEVKRLREAVVAATTLAGLSRDAVLEEASNAAKDAEYDHDPTVTRRNSVEAIRALKSQPAEHYLPESKVREVRRIVETLVSAVAGLKAGQPCNWLEDEWPRINAVRTVLRLGVDLDANGAFPSPAACIWCGAEVSGRCPCDVGVGP